VQSGRRSAGRRGGHGSGLAVPEAWRSKRFGILVIAAAVMLATGLGFGVGRVIGLGNTVILTAIPKPATGQDAFIEDDDGIAQDNQENILQSAAPGMVHILSGGTSVGIGLVLTESGKVLTTYQPGAGASNLAAEYVLSRRTYSATVLSTDPAAGLALLQLDGGAGRPFSTVRVGNSATLVKSSEASRESSYHVHGQVYVTAVGTAGRQDALTLDVGTLDYLDTTVSLGWSTRSGLNIMGYAIPINTALAVATRIADGDS
jgi:S1-C subfamily serine protease